MYWVVTQLYNTLNRYLLMLHAYVTVGMIKDVFNWAVTHSYNTMNRYLLNVTRVCNPFHDETSLTWRLQSN